ncbi:MAG: peptidyl-prolyl cis-trans isomerase [Myxococcales bacterium]|nr:peptidyl-prolyl cis-trans isomerase [Myxococcales bacterium]
MTHVPQPRCPSGRGRSTGWRRAACLALGLVASGCGAGATWPDWVGGGLAVTGPLRLAAEEAAATEERQRIAAEPEQITASHVLVMHRASKSKPPNVIRSREEAQARAQECLLKLRGGIKFEDVVGEYSDEPGAGARGGNLGAFKRDAMVKAFSDAAFHLKVGEISEVIETPYGFHIIRRTR